MRPSASGTSSRGLVPAPLLVANALVLGVAGLAAVLSAGAPDLYRRAVQEDGSLEWASFFAFLGAGLAAAGGAWRARRLGARPWFLLGLCVFSLAVAGEEISWGQRALGYVPPTYFLERNYQQELNVHNVLAKELRRSALEAVILGYGVALPVLARVGALARLWRALGVAAPPLGLAPGFAAAFALYQLYPWRFTGEWVEMMLGLGLLFGAQLSAPAAGGGERPRRAPGRDALRLVLAAALVAAAASASAAWSRGQREATPGNVEAARRETEALARDFAAARPSTPCGLHRRLYTFVDQGGVEALERGDFARLEPQGLPEERRVFFLDPWGSPYWIGDACSEDRRRRRISIYSFGPNRMRDSSDWQLGGDDVGAVAFEAGPGGAPDPASRGEGRP